MTTPVADFVRRYAASGTARFHMPGHKGRAFLGCEALDITEIDGADALYEAAGILAESESNAAALFGAGRTLYSTEGSSQCIRAMVYLAATEWAAKQSRNPSAAGARTRGAVRPMENVKQNNAPPAAASPAPLKRRAEEAGSAKMGGTETARKGGNRPLILAGRNAHKSFLYAAALVDADIIWLWPENLSARQNSLCSCPIAPERLRRTLQNLSARQKGALAAVYLTSPDYLGGQLDLAALSAVCRDFAAPLLVDNAHGAYLRFLNPPAHPLDLGAALCCDSAHKTLPALTGGAYLHIGREAPPGFRERAKAAMALFGSTSPSYLILASLDLCGRYLAEDYPARLADTVRRLDALRARLRGRGWRVEESDPLRLTLCANNGAIHGGAITDRLRKGGIAWEYADRDYVVLMATPENTPEELDRIAAALGKPDNKPPLARGGRGSKPEIVLSPREALFAPSERIPAAQSIGRICGAPCVGCPPAIPIAVAGEVIDAEAVRLFAAYGVTEIEVVMPENGF